MTETKNTTPAIKVLMADDYSLLISGVKNILSPYDIEIVAETHEPKQVKPLFQEIKPDVVLTGLKFGQENAGLDIVKEILKIDPCANLIVISQYDHIYQIKETYNCGAKSFLTKSCNEEQLITAIQLASKGKVYILPEVAQKMAKDIAKGSTSPKTILNNTEFEIFKLLSHGYKAAEMAPTVNLSPKSISRHSLLIKSKLNVVRDADLTKLAIKHGVINLDCI